MRIVQNRPQRRLALGDLKQGVQCIHEAVGLTGLGPGDDALAVSADQPPDLLHRFDLGAHEVGAPVLEHG